MKKSIIIIFSFLFLLNYQIISGQNIYQQTFKFSRVIEYLSKYYVDTVNIENIVEKAIRDILKELDPHSNYLTPEEAKESKEPLEGSFEGIGISFNILNDTLFVISPISGGPSEKVGILAGDRILKVDGKNIASIGLTNEDVFSLLRGKKGTEVNIIVLRRNVKELLDFSIIRDKIPIFSIDASYKVSDDIGYIKINRFAQTTLDEFKEKINELKYNGAKHLILDLTGNGGGLLDAAISLSDEFLDGDKLIVYTEGLNSPRKEVLATSGGIFENGNLVILIDEGSASASEIVSGAVQDWDRGLIIGRRSFGKGLVQWQLDLPDNSLIRLTVARYYTPSGRSIQKPYDGGRAEYERDIIERYNHGEFTSRDSIDLPDSLKYYTLINKRTVYGGGGIMPDIFIPLDTNSYSDYYNGLVRKGIFNKFILRYVDKNRKMLNSKYPDFDKFKNNFFADDDMINELIEYSESEGFKPEKNDLEISGDSIKLYIKAFVARDLWSTNEFYSVINESDEKFIKALEVLKNWELYSSKYLDN